MPNGNGKGSRLQKLLSLDAQGEGQWVRERNYVVWLRERNHIVWVREGKIYRRKNVDQYILSTMQNFEVGNIMK